MEIPQELDDHVKHCIDYTLGLPLPNHALYSKLQSLETAHHCLRDRYLALQLKLKQKDDSIERARAEACMNAQSLKKFVEENQKLASECAHLLNQCSKWERECSLYDRDREALMEFGNEADERAKVAETRVFELEEELKKISEEVRFRKQELERLSVGSSDGCISLEQNLLDGLVASLVNRDEVSKTARVFLETKSGDETCQKLLKMWNSLRPGTQNTISLAAQVQVLQKEKEHLRTNLHVAEEEVNALFQENIILDKENRRLMRQRSSEKKRNGSGGKHSGSTAAKTNKRKSSPRTGSPVGKKIDFNDLESPRQALSPLHENSHDSRTRKR